MNSHVTTLSAYCYLSLCYIYMHYDALICGALQINVLNLQESTVNYNVLDICNLQATLEDLLLISNTLITA